MSKASILLKKIKENCDGTVNSTGIISNPLSIGSVSSLHSVAPADPNGIVPDKSIIKSEKRKDKKSFFNGKFIENKDRKDTVASRILEGTNIKKELGALDAWKHQLNMDILPDKVVADQLKMNDVPSDVLEILLLADPASANSFIYRVGGAELDKYCRVLNSLPDGIKVVLRSGSIVVFDNRNNAYSYNREALTNLLLSKRSDIEEK